MEKKKYIYRYFSLFSESQCFKWKRALVLLFLELFLPKLRSQSHHLQPTQPLANASLQPWLHVQEAGGGATRHRPWQVELGERGWRILQEGWEVFQNDFLVGQGWFWFSLRNNKCWSWGREYGKGVVIRWGMRKGKLRYPLLLPLFSLLVTTPEKNCQGAGRFLGTFPGYFAWTPNSWEERICRSSLSLPFSFFPFIFTYVDDSNNWSEKKYIYIKYYHLTARTGHSQLHRTYPIIKWTLDRLESPFIGH